MKAALNDGQTRLQVELVFPEIALQAQSIALQFITEFEELANGLKVFFPDTGAAALARRDWGTVPFKITDLGSSRSPIAEKIESEDQVFLLVNASSIEVAQVEQLCNAADSRPVILLTPVWKTQLPLALVMQAVNCAIAFSIPSNLATTSDPYQRPPFSVATLSLGKYG